MLSDPEYRILVAVFNKREETHPAEPLSALISRGLIQGDSANGYTLTDAGQEEMRQAELPVPLDN